VWRLAFESIPGDYPETPPDYYLINSDGTGLEKVAALPSIPIIPPPKGSPPYFINVPTKLSPDGSHLAYTGPDGLYIANLERGETRHVFQPNSDTVPGATWISPILGPFCWTPDGSAVRFVVRAAKDSTHLSIFYAIDRNGENLRRLFATDLGIDFGDCSPDGREMAFSAGLGLYIIDLDSGKWRRILADYFVYRIRTCPTESTP